MDALLDETNPWPPNCLDVNADEREKFCEVCPMSAPEIPFRPASVSGMTAREGSVVAEDGSPAHQRNGGDDQGFEMRMPQYAELTTRMVWTVHHHVLAA